MSVARAAAHGSGIRRTVVGLAAALLALSRPASRVNAAAGTAAAPAPTGAAHSPVGGDTPETSTPPATPAALPTEAQIRATFERGDYPATVEQINRALRHQGPGAPGYDRYELALLRAQCHLRLKQVPTAAAAFNAAARLTDDESKAAAARATGRLVAEAKGGVVRQRYPAKGSPAATADLLDPAQHPQALRIYRDDLRAVAGPRVEAALRAKAVTPIFPALDAVADKLDFERGTADGTYGQDVETRRELAEHARTLIEGRLKEMEGDVDRIYASASTIESEGPSKRLPRRGRVAYASVVYRGLSKQDKAELRLVMATCEQVWPTLAKLGRATEPEPKRDKGMARRAADIRMIADRVLRNTYYDEGG